MNALEVATVAVLAAALCVVVKAACIDQKSRIIPNTLVAALAVLWALWRVVLGICACWGQAPGVDDAFFPPIERFCVAAWSAQPLGFADVPSGLMGAAVFGVGLLLLTVVFEALTKKDALGGGDIKLVAVMALFLGFGGAATSLVIACIVALVLVCAERLRHRRAHASAANAGGAASEQLSDASNTFPFAPALAVGFAVVVVFGVVFALMG